MSNFDEATALPVLDPGLVLPTPLQAKPQTQDPNPNNPTWGLGGALLVWVGSIVLVIFMPLVFLVPYLLSRAAEFGGSAPAMLEFAVKDKTALLLQLVAVLPTHVITFVLVWLLVTRFGKQSFRKALGLDWSTQIPWWLDLIFSAVLGTALFIVGSLIAKLLGAEKPTQLEQIINSSLAARYTIAFLAVFTAPFVEEFIYRGVLYAALQKTVGVYTAQILAPFGVTLDRDTQERLGLWGAVVLVLLLFTIIHVPQYWPNVGVIAAVALLSIALTLVRAFSGRLLPCVVIHLVFNGIQAVLLILEPFVHRFLPTPQQVPPTAGLLMSLIKLHF